MRTIICIVLFLSIPVVSIAAEDLVTGPYLGQEPPDSTPVLFASGILPVEGIQHCFPSFSPDGREVYWMTIDISSGRPKSEIWYMEEVHGHWSKPQIAPFSGTVTLLSQLTGRDYISYRSVLTISAKREISGM